MPDITFSESRGREPEGLKDGGHIILACSNCRAGLVDIHVTRPHEPQEWQYRASCPFCGDKSFVRTIKGGIHYSGFGKPCPDDPDETIPSTVVEYVEPDDDVYLFRVKATGSPITVSH